MVCTFVHEAKRKEIREVDLMRKSLKYICVKKVLIELLNKDLCSSTPVSQ
jgi:hypothetical protein